eukprot:scaffold25706_cov75-Skeletonema_dohrnii-CCMP3373.AAC.1
MKASINKVVHHQPSLRQHHANATNNTTQHNTSCINRTSIPLICQMTHSQAWNFSELSSYGHFEHDWSDDTLSTLCDDNDAVSDCVLVFGRLNAFHHGAPNDSIFCPRADDYIIW